MKGRPNSHARYRDLIAARLDGPLTRTELRTLTAHLKSCAQCRQVDREYREQRQQLRSLPSAIPPRDLWARTSSALEREVARGSYRRQGNRGIFGAGRRSTAPSAALLTSIAAVAMVGALAVLQFGPALQRSPAAVPGMPTPFAVSPQSLAFIGSGAADIAIYRTQVSQVCPPSAPDCVADDGIERTTVNLPGNARPRNAALSPNGSQVALVGQYVGEDVIAVVTLPEAAGAGGLPSAQPGSSGQPNATDEQPGSSEPPTTDPQQPTAQPSGPDGPDSPTTDPVADTPPPSPADPSPNVVAILEDVHITGAPPAWSPNSETLAFSAMPADGSHGPDIYVWSAGDAHARPITDDHRSFFASWSGRRIVISRMAAADKAQAEVRTLIKDPATLEERTVDVASIWLPAVNASRTHAVVWYGELGLVDGLPAPKSGALYLVDWAAIDPFADNAPTPTPEPTVEPTPEPTTEPTPEPTAEPTAEPTPEGTVEPAPETSPETSPEPTAESAAESAADASAREVAPPATPGSDTDGATTNEGAQTATDTQPDAATADPTVTPGGFVAIEPDRDPSADPVVDWNAQWSADGRVLGIWTADVLGSTWGRLSIRALDARESVALHPDAVTAPVLAQRGFTLGNNRLAWVGPAEGDPDGELRIRTWGSDGDGGLRLLPLNGEEVVPAF